MLRRVLQVVALACVAIAGASPAQAQFRFSTEAVFMDRNEADGDPLIIGQDNVSSDPSYDLQTGYRFTLGGSFDRYDVEFIGMQVDDWNASSSGTLVSELILDDTFNNPIVVPVLPGNHFGFSDSISDAANGGVEALESERLQAGATWFINGSSRFQDYQINFGTNPHQNPWRVAVGYRHMRLTEQQGFGVRGTFDAIDTEDGAVFGDLGNDANDGLSDSALTGEGFALAGGTGDGFDAFDVLAGPDTVRIYYANSTKNILNGVQASGSYVFPTDIVSLEAFSRTGIYHNYVQADLGEMILGEVNDDSVYSKTTRGSKHGVAFGGSLGLKLEVPITDYISLTAGYEAIYVANVALAPNQYGGYNYGPLGNRRYSVRGGDTLIMSGGTLGMLVTW